MALKLGLQLWSIRHWKDARVRIEGSSRGWVTKILLRDAPECSGMHWEAQGSSGMGNEAQVKGWVIKRLDVIKNQQRCRPIFCELLKGRLCAANQRSSAQFLLWFVIPSHGTELRLIVFVGTESRDPNYKEDDVVFGNFDWRTTTDAEDRKYTELEKLSDYKGLSYSLGLGALGRPGWVLSSSVESCRKLSDLPSAFGRIEIWYRDVKKGFPMQFTSKSISISNLSETG